MAWQVQFARSAVRQLEKLDRQTQRRVLSYLRERVTPSTNPRSIGEALRGELRELWKYRLGDFRLICQINDSDHTILVLKVGHRREVYR